MMPLTLAAVGEENTIKRVGGKPEVRKHLENLGLVAGSSVTVVSALGGNVIVHVKDARIVIYELAVIIFSYRRDSGGVLFFIL